MCQINYTGVAKYTPNSWQFMMHLNIMLTEVIKLYVWFITKTSLKRGEAYFDTKLCTLFEAEAKIFETPSRFTGFQAHRTFIVCSAAFVWLVIFPQVVITRRFVSTSTPFCTCNYIIFLIKILYFFLISRWLLSHSHINTHDKTYKIQRIIGK